MLGEATLDRDLMSFKKYSLRDSTVLNSLFNDVYCVILEIVVKNAFSYSKVFVWVFYDWLLEVALELKYLYSY